MKCKLTVTGMLFFVCLFLSSAPIAKAGIYDPSQTALHFLVGKHVVDFAGFLSFEGKIPEKASNASGRQSSFDLHHFSVLLASVLNEKASVEMLIDYEHGGRDLEFDYGFLEYKVSNAVKVRLGKFYVPFGYYNEYFIPAVTNKTITAPYTSGEIFFPYFYDVGVQLKGELIPGILDYKVYMINGADGTDGAAMSSLNETENTNDHTGNMYDGNNDKAFGGRIGVRHPNNKLGAGLSFYSGEYDPNGQYGITSYGLDASADIGKLMLYGEYVYTTQESSYRNDVNRDGWFIEAAYDLGRFEPVIRYDYGSDMGSIATSALKDKERWSFSLNIEIEEGFFWKNTYDLVKEQNNTGAKDDVFMTQFVVVF